MKNLLKKLTSLFRSDALAENIIEVTSVQRNFNPANEAVCRKHSKNDWLGDAMRHMRDDGTC